VGAVLSAVRVSSAQVGRKELLRILIEDITVNVAGDSELVDVTITSVGGHQTAGRAARLVSRLDQLSHFPRSWPASPGSPKPGRTARRSRTS
jgi:hypothetical protein